jgi:hypothetical protein
VSGVCSWRVMCVSRVVGMGPNISPEFGSVHSPRAPAARACTARTGAEPGRIAARGGGAGAKGAAPGGGGRGGGGRAVRPAARYLCGAERLGLG